jgi:hypothetical protein
VADSGIRYVHPPKFHIFTICFTSQVFRQYLSTYHNLVASPAAIASIFSKRRIASLLNFSAKFKQTCPIWNANASQKYATISRPWQLVIERITFRSLSACIADLADLGSLFTGKGAHHCDCLASLYVHLSTAPFRPGCCYVKRLPPVKEEKQLLSRSIAQLFNMIQDMEAASLRRHRPLSAWLLCTTTSNGGGPAVAVLSI